MLRKISPNNPQFYIGKLPSKPPWKFTARSLLIEHLAGISAQRQFARERREAKQDGAAREKLESTYGAELERLSDDQRAELLVAAEPDENVRKMLGRNMRHDAMLGQLTARNGHATAPV